MNKTTSKIYSYTGLLSSLLGLIFCCLYWVGSVDISPLDSAEELFGFKFIGNNFMFPTLAPFFNSLFSGMSYLVFIFPFTLLFFSLAKRYNFNSWAELRDHEQQERIKSFKDCGNVIDVEPQKGALLSSNRVTVKTTDGVYQCRGTLTAVKKGSKVQRQYDDLIVIDNGKEKRLTLV